MSLLEPFAWSRVAVVDDNEAGATLVEKTLVRSGLKHVDRILDSREVEDWVSEHDPDLVLIDLHMPHVDGYEVLARLRERTTSADLPIIVLTADATMEASRRALGLGANDFLIKPLENTELIHRVRTMLDMRAAHRALQRRQRWMEAAELYARELFFGEVPDPVASVATTARRLSDADFVLTTPSPTDAGERSDPDATTYGWAADDTPLPRPVLQLDASLHERLRQPAAEALLLDGCGAAQLVEVGNLDSSEIGSTLLIPFQGTEGPRGVVCLVRHRDREPFSATDLDGAHQFVTRAATAMELVNRREDRRRYLDFFETLVSQVAEYAIVGLDAEGRVASWNAGAARVQGYRAEEVLGEHFALFCIDDDVNGGLPERLLAEARDCGLSRHQGWGVRSDGSRFWAEISLTALRDQRGALLGYAAVTRDMTEARRLEMARESFFASVSHDIRAPLTAIQGFAEMIPVVDPAQQEEYVGRVRSNVTRLGLMVDNMVDHARLRAGALPIVIEPLDLAEAVATCARDLAPVLATHEVVADESDVHVLADREALGRVLANLLVNAAKYSPPGTKIEVVLEAVPPFGRIVVADHGRGIEEADLTTIFNEFERGALATSDGGSGLGLSSVHQLVTLQRGHVAIESKPGDGTAVIVDLPLAY